MDRRTRSGIRAPRARRVTLALAVLATGLCLAWPFRRTPPAPSSLSQVVDQPLTLGEGVSLQLPGQTATAPLSLPPRTPRPADSELDVAAAGESSTAPPPASSARPPALPDRYRPLFRPSGDDGAGSPPVLPTGSPVRPAPPPALPAAARPRQHTIHDGDTLASLAARYLGDAQRAGEILEANRSVLSDPELLPIGVTIVIPLAADSTAVETAASEDAPRLVPLPLGGLGRER